MRFRGSNENICKMMTSHLRTLFVSYANIHGHLRSPDAVVCEGSLCHNVRQKIIFKFECDPTRIFAFKTTEQRERRKNPCSLDKQFFDFMFIIRSEVLRPTDWLTENHSRLSSVRFMVDFDSLTQQSFEYFVWLKMGSFLPCPYMTITDRMWSVKHPGLSSTASNITEAENQYSILSLLEFICHVVLSCRSRSGAYSSSCENTKI